MLSILSSWIKQIILVVIFTTVVDFLLPGDKYLRYARVLLGLVVMISIINPLLGLFHKENFFSGYNINFNTQLISQAEITKKADNIKKINNELIIKQYKDNLISLIKNHINEKNIFEVKNINLEIVEQNERSDFGRIVNISVSLKPVSEITSNVQDKNNIQKVSVKFDKIDKNESNNRNSLDYKDDLIELKKYLQTELGIPENIIKLQLEGE